MGKKKIGEVLFDGVKQTVVANGKYSSKLAARAVKQLDARHKSGVISEQEYYKELEAIRDKYLYKGCEDWWEYTAKIGAYEKKILTENAAAVANAYEEMTTAAIGDVDALIAEADKAFTSILKEKEGFSKKLAEYGEFYSKGTVTIKNAGPGLQFVDGAWVNQKDIVFDYVEFADFEKQVGVLENYRDVLVAIKERGDVPTEIFDAIKGLSVEEGLGVAEALLKMPDEDFKKYVAGYMEKKQLEAEIANELFDGDIESTKA
ncbi:MAG: hypothetical protein IKL09_02280 [Clostridia bacterium]|nr:hypothetical protein [Clostridia bacterium]